MKLVRYELLGIGFFYFLVLLAMALWVRDVPCVYNAFELTSQQLVETRPLSGDPASFVTAAMDIAKNGWISSQNEWIFNLWPPGFVLLETLIIKVLGIDAPIVLVLQILASGLFSIVLALLYGLLRDNVGRKASVVLPLMIFAFPVSRAFLLQPRGVALGESFSIGLFLLGILLALRSAQWNALRCAAYAGICFALSAYFRSQFELILLALTGWGALVVVLLRLKHLKVVIEPRLKTLVVRTMGVVLLVAHAATFPWRVYHLIYQGSPLWVVTSNYTFRYSVMPSAQLEKDGGGFVVAGGGNLTCRIDPTTCGDINNAKQLFVKTFLTHPFEWYSLKLNLIGKYWFSSVRNLAGVGKISTSMDFATNTILLVQIIAVVALLFSQKVKSHISWIFLVWFSGALFSVYGLIYTVSHFEVRYFYFPKIVGIMMFLMLGSLYFRRIEKSEVG